MRDGVRLATDVYHPDAPGPFPVILIRTPYSTNVESIVQDGIYFAQRGYAVIVQDVRGRFDSEGEWTPFLHEAEDGYDAQEWCGTQPWSTGKVGTSGGSYLALTQWLAAPLRNRHLAAMAPRVGFSNLYHNWVYTGGAFQLGFNLRWGAVQMHTRTNRLQYLAVPPELHYSTLFQHLPLITGMRTPAGIAPPTRSGSAIRPSAPTGTASATSSAPTATSRCRPTGSAAGTTSSSKGP